MNNKLLTDTENTKGGLLPNHLSKLKQYVAELSQVETI